MLRRFADRGCRNGDDGEADALLRADAYLSTQPARAESEKGQLKGHSRRRRRQVVDGAERGWLLR